MLSPLQKKRLLYKPKIPSILEEIENTCFQKIPRTSDFCPEIKALFPNTYQKEGYKLVKGEGKKGELTIGVLFSGGPAPGGHNVIVALKDVGATVIGFLKGPSGLINNTFEKLGSLEEFRNQGGFDLIGSGREKIDTEEKLQASLQTAQKHNLDGLVIIGGDDSNTNAAILAEYFIKHQCKTSVIGVPKTIDADLRSDEIEISFGFDTACKTYSELIGNIAKDAISSQKYYHFIKLMGRSASHITLECAMACCPNIALISEEKRSLNEMIEELSELVIKRFSKGKEYGVILLPEGLIEFVDELKEKAQEFGLQVDPHGNIELSKIETEKFLIELVEKALKKKGFEGPFRAQRHFFGYEGRCAMPSNFDANYCYTLGLICFVAIREGLTGVICAVQNLKKDPKEWEIQAVPITSLLHMETRKGKKIPVIKKTLVDKKSPLYIKFLQEKTKWQAEDHYRCPGPIQFFGDEELTCSVPLTL